MPVGVACRSDGAGGHPAVSTRRLIGMLSRGKTPILEVDGQRMKVCECKAHFPVEYNTRGQMTSRALCDRCRERRARRHADDLPDIEGVPRCVECTALVGLEWGTVTYLDADGRCL